MDLQNYLKAGYPGFYIETEEPLCAISSIETATWQSFSWDCLRGLTDNKAFDNVDKDLNQKSQQTSQQKKQQERRNYHANATKKSMSQMQEHSSPDWNKILLPLRLESESRIIKSTKFQSQK